LSKKGRISLALLLGTVFLMVLVTSSEMARRRYNERHMAAQEGSGVEQ
jgi:hypothetical protein